MSDFDKEAEREKLREKYEQEEKQREATEQMSELLLKGATMTNAHCSDCGDPIFRYDGQEFCPTCEKPVDRGGDANGEDAADDGNVEVADPSDDARVRFGGQDDPETPAEPSDGESGSEQSVDNGTQDTNSQRADAEDRPAEPTRSAPSLDPSDSTRVADRSPSLPQSASGAEDTSASTAGRGDVGRGDVEDSIASARASLARTAARFARAAENTDDPTVAVDHLEAAREAAAALDELD